MPPSPKPPERRSHGRRTPALVPRGSKPPAVIPEPPDAWLAATKQAWTEYWSSPVASHIISSDLAGLRSLFVMRDRQERFWRAGMRKPTVQGSTGQLVVHPLVKAAIELEPKIQALADRYGANPRGRLSLTVGLGDAARSVADLTNDDVLAGDVAPIDLYAVDGDAG
jgi:hypothetical protein